MTPQERKSLAEQITGNPLYHDLMAELEASYIERLVYAPDEQSRIAAQAHVHAARAFRDDLAVLLQDTAPAKGGFA
jgi:hypothetical protein